MQSKELDKQQIQKDNTTTNARVQKQQMRTS